MQTCLWTYADSKGPDQTVRPLIESLDTIEFINGEQRPGCDLSHVQDGVNPHM